MYLNYNYAIHLIKAHTAKSPINYQAYLIKAEILYGGTAK